MQSGETEGSSAPDNAEKNSTTKDTMKEDVIKEARRICHRHCRAALCKDNRRCFNSYPAPGYSYFEEYLEIARREIEL